VIEDFLKAAEELFYEGADGEGLTDPVDCEAPGGGGHPCCASPSPSICNPCCVPASQRPPDLQCPPNIDTICAENSPYFGGASSYPWLYRGGVQDETDGFISLIESIGYDDLHARYDRDPANPEPYDREIFQPGNGPYFDPNPPPTLPRMEDISGFYAADPRTGLFDTFYKLKDWGLVLKDLTYAGDECHWCDPDFSGIACPAPVEPELELRFNPALEPWLIYAGGPCVDNENTTDEHGPQILDAIPMPDIFLDEDECGAFAPLSQSGKGWKSGADWYCSSVWPYDAGCEKHGGVDQCTEPGPDGDIPVDCDCGQGAAQNKEELWRDDALDALVWEIEEAEAVFGLLLGQDPAALVASFEDWYETIAEWIEPGCDDPEDCPVSFTKELRGGKAQGGIFWQWLDTLQYFIDQIERWENPQLDLGHLPPPTRYEGEGCRVENGTTENPAVLCIPPEQGSLNEHGVPECAGVTVDEANTFGSGAARGNLNSVISCLDWNANDEIQYLTVGPSGDVIQETATGNQDKFWACLQECVYSNDHPIIDPANTCGRLPRGLYQPMPEYQPEFCEIERLIGDPEEYLIPILYNESVAWNQVPKLRKRLEVLQDRRTALSQIRNLMEGALDRLSNFICGPVSIGEDREWSCGRGQGAFTVGPDSNSPVEKLIYARMNWDPPKTESVVVYAWQDEKRTEPRNRPGGADPYAAEGRMSGSLRVLPGSRPRVKGSSDRGAVMS